MIKKLIDKYPRLWEIFKFLFTGGVATIIDYLIMALVLYIWQPSLYSGFFDVIFGNKEPDAWATVVGTGVGFSISAIFNYLFSILIVFTLSDTSKAKTKTGFIVFYSLALAGLGIHLLGMYLGYTVLDINEWIVKIILTVVVLIFNYVTRKLILFKDKKKSEEKNDNT